VQRRIRSTSVLSVGPTAASDTRRAGIALCLVSACGFGLMAIFATQAYDAGVGVTSLLATRFALAAGMFWAIVGVRRARSARAGGRDADASSRPSRRIVLASLALGGVGYSVQSGLFFSALRHIDVSLTSLLLYTFPALVCCGSVALGRERMTAFKASVLGLASAGTALVLLGGGVGGLQATGVLLGLGAGVAYSVYVLITEDVVARIDAWLFSALVTSGAATTFLVTGLISGALAVPGVEGLLWVTAIAVFSTVVPISTFLLGMERVGAPTASIVSTVEPVLTVSLAVILLGEGLATGQVLGAILVIGAVIALSSPRASRERESAAGVSVAFDGPTPAPAGPAPARTPAREPA
jgi:drug/metabolite transporter (DMT)-like permease